MSTRVLLVEDVTSMHGVLADLLATIGDFEVVGALRTEAEAKFWLTEHPGGWDLAIIDLILEQGTGMGVIPLAAEQSEASGGKVVVFSDYATPGIRKHCRQLGADAVFQKAEETQDFIRYCAQRGGCALERA